MARKDKSKEMAWEQLGSLKVGQPLLPEHFRILARDAYFGLNTSYGKPTWRSTTHTRAEWQPLTAELTHRQADLLQKLKDKQREQKKRGQHRALDTAGFPSEQVTVTETKWTRATHPTTGLPIYTHNLNTLRWLNVAYVDLDCYKVGLTVGDTLGAFVTMQDAGELPAASVIVRSGRGLWCLWFLRDEMNPSEGERQVHGVTHTPNTPQRATRYSLRDYAAVQAAIVRKLTHLGADLGAVDATRYAPIPGTKKSTADSSQVEYWIQANANGTVPDYTLSELKAALNVQDAPAHPKVDAYFTREPLDAKQQAQREHGQRGHRQRWMYVVLELEALFALRRGYGNASSRNRAAFFHAAALKRSGLELPEVADRVRKFWDMSRFRKGDELTDIELDHALKQACKKQKSGKHSQFSRAKYLAELKVTDAERSFMDAAANRRTPPPPPAAPRQQDRLDAILQAINTTFKGKPPSSREMCEHLRQQGVDCGNHVTVYRDYLRLGLKPAGKAGRPPKLPEM